jgi:predicted metalloprotease with PDZ domain
VADELPAGWEIAAPLEQEGHRKFSAPSYDALVDAPLEAGTFRRTSFHQDSTDYEVVVDAAPADYDMKRLSMMLSRVTAAEVAWMQDRPFRDYMFIFHFPHGATGGGMEHANSCAIEVDAGRVAADPLDLESVTAHEFFHLWNVKRIRPSSLEPIDYTRENYTRALWFSEGVTDAVADITLLRAGLLSEPEFLQQLARGIRTLELRPAHDWQSAEASSLDAWLEKYPEYGSPERSISYYNKGDLIGVLLDLEMRRVTKGRKSLRDLFQWMNRHYAMHHQP